MSERNERFGGACNKYAVRALHGVFACVCALAILLVAADAWADSCASVIDGASGEGYEGRYGGYDAAGLCHKRDISESECRSLAGDLFYAFFADNGAGYTHCVFRYPSGNAGRGNSSPSAAGRSSPPLGPRCGTGYCPEGFKCDSRNKCLPSDAVDCGSYACKAGDKCGSGERCLQADEVDCGNGTSCEPGHLCLKNGSCLRRDSSRVCRDMSICPPSTMCINNDKCLSFHSPRACWSAMPADVSEEVFFEASHHYCEEGYHCVYEDPKYKCAADDPAGQTADNAPDEPAPQPRQDPGPVAGNPQSPGGQPSGPYDPGYPYNQYKTADSKQLSCSDDLPGSLFVTGPVEYSCRQTQLSHLQSSILDNSIKKFIAWACGRGDDDMAARHNAGARANEAIFQMELDLARATRADSNRGEHFVPDKMDLHCVRVAGPH